MIDVTHSADGVGPRLHGKTRGKAWSKACRVTSGCVGLLVPCVALASFACTSHSVDSRTTQEADLLSSAATFAVLGASTVTSTGPTVITGIVGLSPGTAVTGFPPGIATEPFDVADGAAAQGQLDLVSAWTTLKDEPCGTTLTSADLGGLTLTPGVYCFTSSSASLTGAVTLDAQGQADAAFVFQIASTLTTAAGASVVVTNGGSDCNVFWEVGSSATLGTGTRFGGTILALTSITVTTGATVAGRLLAHTGAVTLDSDTVSSCAGVAVDAGSSSTDAGRDAVAAHDAGRDAFIGGNDAGRDAFTGVTDAGHDTATGVIDAGHDTSTGVIDAAHDVATGVTDAGRDAAADSSDASTGGRDASTDGCASSTPCP
jgi:hypothetical protein